MNVFVTRLCSLNKTCEFGDQTDEAIRDQAIDKCVSIELRRRLRYRSLETVDNFPCIRTVTFSSSRNGTVLYAIVRFHKRHSTKA